MTDNCCIRLDTQTRLEWQYVQALADLCGKTSPTMTELVRRAVNRYIHELNTTITESPEDLGYELTEISRTRKPRSASVTIQQVKEELSQGLKPLNVIQAKLNRQYFDKLLSGDLLRGDDQDE